MTRKAGIVIFINSIIEAWRLLISFNKEIYGIISLTLAVTFFSTGITAFLGIPAGVLLGSTEFAGRRLVIRIMNTLMGIPPVVAGLVVYMMLSRKGPLGFAGLLFTPAAMVIAQVIIILPVITALTVGAVRLKSIVVKETCKGLGIGRIGMYWLLLGECKYPIFSAILASYGRAISEVGAVMLVGGNIQYSTRVMTTAIVLETGKGNYDKALALGIILISISFVINWILQGFQEA